MHISERTETNNLIQTLTYLIDKASGEINSDNLVQKMQEIGALTIKRESAKARLTDDKREQTFGYEYYLPKTTNH